MVEDPRNDEKKRSDSVEDGQATGDTLDQSLDESMPPTSSMLSSSTSSFSFEELPFPPLQMQGDLPVNAPPFQKNDETTEPAVPLPPIERPLPSAPALPVLPETSGVSSLKTSEDLEALWAQAESEGHDLWNAWDSVDEYDSNVARVGLILCQIRDFLDVAQSDSALDLALDFTHNDSNAANALISLAEDAHLTVHSEGELLVRARQPSSELWILLDGTADSFLVAGSETRMTPHHLESGDVFGSLTPGDFEMETISATSPCRALHLTLDSLLRVASRLPNMSEQLQLMAETRISKLVFGENSVLASLGNDERLKVFSLMRRCSFAAGEHLTEEGHQNHYLYFIASGRVASYQQLPEVGEQQIAILSSGDCIGEASLLRDCPANARTQAITQVTAFLLDKEGFRLLMHSYPTVRKALIELAQRRIDENAVRLRNATAPLPPLNVKPITEEISSVPAAPAPPPVIYNIASHRDTCTQDLDPLGSLGHSKFLDDD